MLFISRSQIVILVLLAGFCGGPAIAQEHLPPAEVPQAKPRLVADTSISLSAGKGHADDFAGGSWRWFSSEDGTTPATTDRSSVESDGGFLVITPTAGLQTVVGWKSGITGTVRIAGSFQVVSGKAEVMLTPPSGVEVVGGRCGAGITAFAFADPDWLGIGPAWTIGDNQFPVALKAVTKADYGLQNGDIGGHSPTSAGAPNDDFSWFKWTAPSDMKVSITGGVWSDFQKARTCNFSIRKNGVDIYGGFRKDGAVAATSEVGGGGKVSAIGSHLIPKTASSENPDPFAINEMTVKAGDEITFNFNSNGEVAQPHAGTFFGMRAIITNPADGRKWNLADDWKIDNGNPNGAWSYGQYVNKPESREINFDFIRRVKAGEEYRFTVARPEDSKNTPCRVQLRATISEVPQSSEKGRLFPGNMPEATWETFQAEGYKNPVTGMIYRNTPRPPSGMPLGGIDTGGLDLDTSGTFGYTSIFNHMVPQGGPVNLPYLGISVGGETWVLTTGKTKSYRVNGVVLSPKSPDLELKGVNKADSIDYFGHYPVADLRYATTCPVSVDLRAWSPFIPRDTVASNTPGAMFEVSLHNTSTSPAQGTLAMSFPGFVRHQSAALSEMVWPSVAMKPILPPQDIAGQPVNGDLTGSWVTDKGWNMSYVLAAMNEPGVRVGGSLGSDGTRWAAISQALPSEDKEGGSSVAVDFKLEPGQSKVVRFVLAWYAPQWDGNGSPGTSSYKPHNNLGLGNQGTKYTHMYASRFASALDVANYLQKNHSSLLGRVIGWQSAIYDDKDLPGWLKASLINSLYYFPKTSFWAQKQPSFGEWCKTGDGVFAMAEAPRACANVSTLANMAISGPTLAYMFPDLLRSQLRSMKAFQKPDGDLPGFMGQYMDPVAPQFYGYQDVMNAANYITQISCYWKVTGDEAFLKEFYPSAKMAIDFALRQRPELGDSQIVALPAPAEGRINQTEWYEDRPYMGYVVHPGGYRLAATEILKDWAQRLGDAGEVQKLDRVLAAGQEAIQKYLWAGDHYLCYKEPITGETIDGFFTPMLNGQFFARQHGVPGVFPPENVSRVLDRMRTVCTISRFGIPPTWADADGTAFTGVGNEYLSGKYLYMYVQPMYIGMTYMYEGQKDFGLDLMRKTQDVYASKWGYTWDGANCFSAKEDNGEMCYGWDYWFNWTIWSAVSAQKNQDVSGPCKPGGLVDRMIKQTKSP